MINLLNNETNWVVVYMIGNESVFKRFLTVDAACDFIVDELHVDDDEVDLAIIHMSTNKHRSGFFTDNKFDRSELE